MLCGEEKVIVRVQMESVHDPANVNDEMILMLYL